MQEASVWNRLAGRYDRIVSLFDHSYPAIRERLERDLRGCRRVLEVAAGTGQFTATIAKVADEVVATDVAPEMVARLQATLAEAGLGRVRTAVMSAYELNADDGAFDGVFCANALHVMEHPKRALSELRRVLESSGVLIVPTFLHGTGPVRRTLSRAMGLVSPFVAHTRFDGASLVTMVEEQGFSVERCDVLPGLFPIGYVVARRAS